MGNFIPCGGREDKDNLSESIHKAAREKSKTTGETYAVGRVVRLVPAQSSWSLFGGRSRSAFGLVKPEGGETLLYFEESMLADGCTWSQFIALASKYDPGNAPILYVLDEGSGKPQANSVTIVSDAEMQEMDADRDGIVTPVELDNFLKAHPEFTSASTTKRKREYRRSHETVEERRLKSEEIVRKRDELFQKHDAAEDILYKQRDDENSKATELFAEGERLWEAGEHQKAKEVQHEAKGHRDKARKLKQDALDLDWQNNEEMFEYVQVEEHKGKERDDTWIDLHGLSADFAQYKTVEALQTARSKGLASLEIITGAGHHSGKSGPVVKQRIYGLLKEKSYNFQQDTTGAVDLSICHPCVVGPP